MNHKNVKIQFSKLGHREEETRETSILYHLKRVNAEREEELTL